MKYENLAFTKTTWERPCPVRVLMKILSYFLFIPAFIIITPYERIIGEGIFQIG